LFPPLCAVISTSAGIAYYAAAIGGFTDLAGNTNRWLSVLYGTACLTVGVPTCIFVLLWLMRPTSRSESTVADAALPPFPTDSRGYDCDEVEAFFAGIASSSPAEIEAVRFHARRGGYERETVDRALDGWVAKNGGATPNRSPSLGTLATATVASTSSLRRWLQS
jgi:hypothetical protein